MSVIIRGALAGGGGNKVKSIQRGTAKIKGKVTDINEAYNYLPTIESKDLAITINKVNPDKCIVIINGAGLANISGSTSILTGGMPIYIKSLTSDTLTLSLSRGTIDSEGTAYNTGNLYTYSSTVGSTATSKSSFDWQVIEYD